MFCRLPQCPLPIKREGLYWNSHRPTSFYSLLIEVFEVLGTPPCQHDVLYGVWCWLHTLTVERTARQASDYVRWRVGKCKMTWEFKAYKVHNSSFWSSCSPLLLFFCYYSFGAPSWRDWAEWQRSFIDSKRVSWIMTKWSCRLLIQKVHLCLPTW